MGSRIDFNQLLAKADKNTNKASKFLEEKKAQTQKAYQKPTQKAESKQSAIAFIEAKKEEIRKRNEQEARELLRKKQLKDGKDSTIVASNKKKGPPTVSKEAIEKYKNASKNSNSTVSSANSYTTKPSTNRPSTNNANATNSNNNNNKKTVPNKASKNSQPAPPPNNSRSKSYYDQIQPQTNISNSKPTSKLKPAIKPGMCSVHRPGMKPSMKPKNGSASAAPKPALSYQDILKLADTARKNGVNNNKPDNKSENIGNRHTDLYFNGKKKTEPEIPMSKTSNKVSDMKYLNDKKASLNKPQKSEIVSKAIPVTSKALNAPGLSSWDRIISDMQKKPTKKNIKKQEFNSKAPKEIYEEEDEDEYDSEMDDFIDDESDSEDEITSKKSYSKEIQQIFRYDPKRYKTIDEGDIDNMETDFHSQIKEEKMSLKMGIMEDLEELKKEAALEKKRLEKQQQKRLLEEGQTSNIKKLKSNKT